MASSKFFTWTKGDRKHAATEYDRAGELMPVPAECLFVRGHARSSKTSWRGSRSPLPSFELSPNLIQQATQRTKSSIELQDAAMQTATSLITAMNDILKSPRLAAHILSSQSPALDAHHKRSRSYTAPSRSASSFVGDSNIAELPGSLPCFDQRRPNSQQHFRTRPIMPAETPSGLGIVGTDQEDLARIQSKSVQITADSSHQPSDPQSMHSTRLLTNDGQHELTPLPRGHQGLIVRPALHQEQSTRSEPCSRSPKTQTQERQRTAFMHQIMIMREGHKKHITCLKEAHLKELSNHVLYIAFLEQLTQRSSSDSSHILQHQLTLDTSHNFTEHSGSNLSSQASASVIMPSSMSELSSNLSSPEAATSASSATTAELSRHDLAPSANKDSVLRAVREELTGMQQQNSQKLAQYKRRVYELKQNERSLQRNLETSEAQLLEANMQRIDVLEGISEAAVQVQDAQRREHELQKQCETLRARLLAYEPLPHRQLQVATKDMAFGELHELDTKRATLQFDTLLEQAQDLRRVVSERDHKIKILEATLEDREKTVIFKSDHDRQVTKLEDIVKSQHLSLVQVQKERDQYKGSLDKMSRRQVQNQRSSPALNLAETDAVAQAHLDHGRHRVTAVPFQSCSTLTKTDRVKELEDQLHKSLQDIISYKVELRKYRTQLVHAHNRIQEYESSSRQESRAQKMIPPMEELACPKSPSMTPLYDIRGLEIPIPSPRHSPNPNSEAKLAATDLHRRLRTSPHNLSSPSSFSTLSSSGSPSSANSSRQAKSPLMIQKALPKTPSQDGSPTPATKRRVSTLHQTKDETSVLNVTNQNTKVQAAHVIEMRRLLDLQSVPDHHDNTIHHISSPPQKTTEATRASSEQHLRACSQSTSASNSKGRDIQPLIPRSGERRQPEGREIVVSGS